MSLKKKICVAILSICLVGMITVGTTYAIFFAKVSTTNVITIGNIDVELIDIYTRPDSVAPGESVSKIVSAKNVGDNDAYVRINLKKTWTKDNKVLENLSTDDIEINFPNPQDWVDGGDGYYYYQKPLAPGETASDLLDSFKLSLSYTDKGIDDLEGNIIVSAEAIQSKNFDPTVNENGAITGWGDIVISEKREGNADKQISSDEESNVSFLNEADKFITLPGEDLFLNFKGLMPGDDAEQQVKVSNKDKDDIYLYMYADQTSLEKFKSESDKDISDELINACTITVTATYDDGTSEVIYEGPVKGQSSEYDMTIPDSIYLGEYRQDEEATLDVKLHVPEEWNVGNVEGKIDWIFDCMKLDDQDVPEEPKKEEQVPSTGTDTPSGSEDTPKVLELFDAAVKQLKTGDASANAFIAFAIIAILSVGAIVVISIKEKKRKDK